MDGLNIWYNRIITRAKKFCRPNFTYTGLNMIAKIDPTTISILLKAWGGGDKRALNDLIEKTYHVLYGIARTQLSDERKEHTLNPTALINEAYVKLDGLQNLRLQNRVQFYALCGVIIRNILVGHARRRNRQKRGDGQTPLVLSEETVEGSSCSELIALDEGLRDLANFDPRKALIVEIRFFAGLTTMEAAEALNLSTPTIKRELRLEKSWLFNYMTAE